VFDKFFGRRRNNDDDDGDDLRQEAPIDTKEKTPAVITFKKKAIWGIVLAVALIFSVSFLFGFNKVKPTETNDDTSPVDDVGRIQSSHLNEVPSTYAEAAKQNDNEKQQNRQQQNVINSASEQSQYPQNYQPVQYSQIPIVQYSEAPLQQQEVPQQIPPARSEYSDAQKSAIRFDVHDDKVTTSQSQQKQ